MPFTLSHPAAVIPFARTRLNFPGLVVGSMSPDFIYLVTLRPNGELTHTLPGIFLYCLPAGLLVLLICHLLSRPLMSMLPFPAPQYRIDSIKMFSLQAVRRLALISLSVVIGAFTHVAWDAFTHEKGWIVQFLPILNMTVFDLGFDKVPLARILHHASSAIGALCLMVWTRNQMRRKIGKSGTAGAAEPLWGRNFRVTLLWVSVSAVAGLLYAWAQGRPIHNYGEFRQMMVQALVAAGSALSLITFFYCITWHMVKRKVPNG
jgi:Domain of unknown function (DUF4184)